MMLFSKNFWSLAFERMVKTIAQVMIASITATTFIPTSGDAWVTILTTSGLAGLVSVLTSLTSYDAVTKAIIPVEAPKPTAQGPVGPVA
jgi:hypothetical protein